MGDKASNLVAHTLGRDDGHFVTDALVRVEVHREARVVLLDDGSRRLLYGLRTDPLHNTVSTKDQRSQPSLHEADNTSSITEHEHGRCKQVHG